jgi:septum formation protein
VFFPLTEEQIDGYIKSGSPMDKAGAYGIQDGGLVERIEGSFSNVVGLPVELLKEMIDGLK